MNRRARTTPEPERGFAIVCVVLGILWILAAWPTRGEIQSHLSWGTDDLMILDLWPEQDGEWTSSPAHQRRAALPEMIDGLIEDRIFPGTTYRIAFIDDRSESGITFVRKTGELKFSDIRWFAVPSDSSAPPQEIEIDGVEPEAVFLVRDLINEFYYWWERTGSGASLAGIRNLEWRYEADEFRWKGLVNVFGPSGAMLILASISALTGRVRSGRRGQRAIA